MALIVTLRGTQTVVDYYTELLAEMKSRVAEGIAAVPHERYRLLWDNLPVWYRTRWLSEKFASHNACLVADTYTSAWCSSLAYLHEDDFIESMAEGYSRIYLNIGVDAADTVSVNGDITATGTITPELLAALAQVEGSGNPLARTPHLDALAARSVRFTNCFNTTTAHRLR